MGWLAAVSIVVACSGAAKPAKPTSPAPSAVQPQPGAQGWTNGGLQLPADTPAVFVGRLDQVLDAASRLKSWITAEPAMLGPDGARNVRTLETGWAAATAYLGVDPLLERAWLDRGIDPSRPLYVGLYPTQIDGQRFVASVEATVREGIGLPPGKAVAPSLRTLAQTGGELPEGTNSSILLAVADSRPLGGLRAVVPISSRTNFMTTVKSFADGMGFRPFPEGLTNGAKQAIDAALWSPTVSSAFSIRFEEDHALLDVLFPPFLGGPRTSTEPSEHLAAVFSDLQRALAELPAGRPLAPAPSGNPALAIAFDQGAMGDLVKLRGYRAGLESVQSAGADRRDIELTASLLAVSAEAELWTVAASSLTGTTFQLDVEPQNSAEVGDVSMTMFGRRDLPALDSVHSTTSLGVAHRTAAFGVDFATLRESGWNKWFDEGGARQLAEVVFEPVSPADAILPGLRVAAIALSSVGHQENATVLSEELGATLQELESVSRLEVVGLTPDVGDYRQPPRFLCAAVMDGSSRPADLIDVQSALAGTLLAWFEPAEFATLPPLQSGVTMSVLMDELPIHQHLIHGKQDVVVFGIGMDAASFESEVAGLSHEKRLTVVEGRVEAVALLSWLRADDTALFEPIDANILAQRLGALTLRYESVRVHGSNGLTVKLELEAPPKL